MENAFLKKMANIVAICTLVIFYSGVGTLITLPTTVHATGGSGSIKTTNASCEENINHYAVGDAVWIMGDNFDSGSYDWDISGLPGGASSDPNTEVASGNFDASEESFCFEAYTVATGDDGEYKATFGNKHDNYHVGGDDDDNNDNEDNDEDEDNDDQDDDDEGGNCPVTTDTIVSDETHTITGGSNAVATFVHANWATIPLATWIWSSADVNPDNMGADETVEFNKSFSVTGTVTNATLELAADNGYTFAIEGDTVSSNPGEHNYESVTGPIDVTANIVAGVNTIVASVTNMANGNLNPHENPAGLVYKLTIEHEDCSTQDDTTVEAVKIVCDSEADLPNWGAGNIASEVTSTTADDFLETHPSCHKEDWDFAWSLDGVGNPGDGTLGTGGAGWNAFSNEIPTSIPVGQRIWFREQPNADYIPFTGQNTTESVSAEIYCGTDVLNYDNWEFIDTVEGDTYHCVAWNVPTEPELPVCNPDEELIQNGDFEAPVLPNATWDIIPASNPLLAWLVDWVSPQTSGRLGLEIQNHVAGDPAQGEQHAELDGDHPVTMWQEIPTVIGQSYVLNFKYSARPGRATADNTIDVKINGAVVGATLANDGTALSNTLWDPETRTFVATGTSTKIEFTDTGTDTSFGGYLDDISLRCGEPENPPVNENSIRVCKVINNGQEGEICEPWADSIASFNQAKRKDGSAVLVTRSDATKALGAAQNNDTENFVSLGFGGRLVIKFTNYIVNGTGDDLRLTETSYGSPSDTNYPEKATVYASQNGSSWTLLGTATQDETFDLGSLAWAQYVMIIDVSDKTSTKFDNATDGYDVDAVEAIHCSNTIPDGTTFTVPFLAGPTSQGVAASVPASVVFTTPLTLNADVVGDDDILDAQCVTYENLADGNYYYGEEVIAPPTGWGAPMYNDVPSGATFISAILGNVFAYSGQLFDGNALNDDDRNTNADGHIVLSSTNKNRTLIVVNTPSSVVDFTECSDAGDNDADQKVDQLDPQCHTDGNAENNASYNPNIDIETGIVPPPVDVCSNIEGNQATVPAGKHLNEAGQCVDDEIIIDVCSNIEGNQSVAPTGTHIEEAQCIDDEIVVVDVCSNIEGSQSVAPIGTHIDGEQCIEDATPPTNNGGGGGNSSGSRSSSSGSSATPIAGRVLGATTSCSIYLEKFMAYRRQNDPAQVMKLQQFLNNYLHLNLPVDGVFGRSTESAVRAFQISRLGTVLTPWGRNLPTGLVYLTTITDINNIMCPDLKIPIPTNLIPFSHHPLAPRAI